MSMKDVGKTSAIFHMSEDARGSHIPEFLTPVGSPEEDFESKFRQHHYGVSWIFESVLL